MSSVPLVKWDEESLGSCLYSLLGMQALNCVFSWSDRRCFRLGVTPGILSLLSTEDPAEVPGALWRSFHTLTAAVDAVVYQVHAGIPGDEPGGKARQVYPSTAAFLDAVSRPGGRELLRPAGAAAVPGAGAPVRSKAAIAEARELLAMLDSGHAEHGLGCAMRIMVLEVLQRWTTGIRAELGDTAAALLAELINLAEDDDALDRLQQRHTNASGDGVSREETLLSVMAKGIRLLEHFVKQGVRCSWFARCMYNVPTFQPYAAGDTPRFRMAKYDPVLHIPVQLATGAGTSLPAAGDKVVQLSPVLHDALQRRLEKRAPHAERVLVVLQTPPDTGQKISAADIGGCAAFLRGKRERAGECGISDRQQPTAAPAAVAAEGATALTGVRGTVSGGTTQLSSNLNARAYAPPIAPRLQPTVSDGAAKQDKPLKVATSTCTAAPAHQPSAAALPDQLAGAAHEATQPTLRSPTRLAARAHAAAVAVSATLPPPVVVAAGSDLECSARTDSATDGVLGANKPRRRGKPSKPHANAAKPRGEDISAPSTPACASPSNTDTAPPGSPTFDDVPVAAGSKRSREDADLLRLDQRTNTLEPAAEASSREDHLGPANPVSALSDRRTPRERLRKAARKDPAFEW